MRIDVHCHIGQRFRPCQPNGRFCFEPADGYAGCDAYLSDRLYNNIGMTLVKWRLGLNQLAADEADQRLEAWLLAHILGSRLLDRAVILAFDQVHTTSGQPLGTRHRGARTGSDLYVSNTYAHHIWRSNPQKLLFGASIHPYHRYGELTAIDMLDEVAAAGAVLIKWLPPTHNIDPADPRTIAFLSHAARIGIPLLIHMGAEAALRNAYPQFGDPTCWLNTFRQLWRNNNMPTVIAAHVATPLFWPITPGHTFHKLTQALTGEFAEVPLFADISALGQVSKAHWLKKLLTMPLIQNKLVYGSDFPLPPMPVAFPFRLAGHYRQLHAFPSWIDRDIAIKASLGIDETVFLRSASLLAHRLNYAHHLVQEGLTSS
ncbi:MAG: hypothetical protein GXY44_00995 [Phycisphaerales bacterium]|nr:hypothetical protein [Phycisphaerales bacterium]